MFETARAGKNNRRLWFFGRMGPQKKSGPGQTDIENNSQ